MGDMMPEMMMKIQPEQMEDMMPRMMDSCFSHMDDERRNFMLGHGRVMLDEIERKFVAGVAS